ncbi:CAP domain-containing protein [Actinomadura latina]|uniref:CAP domain-containing protein n=1 Tax=Actinomadura latina TaxID=163603 RepID=A0A846Z1L5_9ACTN|nr:CAP domain-containing protein [Actinomadura latina]NKZ07160.1 CAP domain-containing protein [Actinomadura latina]
MRRADVPPPRDELVAGGPRRGASRSGPPPRGRRPDDGAAHGRRPGGRGRKRSRAKSATGLMVVVTASGLAIGIGVAIDRLVLPQLRSEKTAASGPDARPSAVIPPGPQSDAPTGTGPESGAPADGRRAPSASPSPTAAEQTPPLKPIHPSKSASAEPSKSKKASEPARPPSGGGGGSPGGGGASSGSEATVVSLTNAERAKEGCQPLRTDSRLTVAARKHSADMAANNYFDHTSRNGDSPWKRMEDAGYTSPGAENIAKGYPTAAAVVKGWMNSPGHRANILNCGLRAIGVGVASGPGGPLWTQDFGWK